MLAFNTDICCFSPFILYCSCSFVIFSLLIKKKKKDNGCLKEASIKDLKPVVKVLKTEPKKKKKKSKLSWVPWKELGLHLLGLGLK